MNRARSSEKEGGGDLPWPQVCLLRLRPSVCLSEVASVRSVVGPRKGFELGHQQERRIHFIWPPGPKERKGKAWGLFGK